MPPAVPRPRRHAAGLATLLALGGAAAAGCARDADARADDGAPRAPNVAESAAVPVRVAPAVVVADAERVRAGGVIEARATAELAFQVGGRLVRVAVDEGMRVARGALLAEVDPTDYRLALRQAALQWSRAEDERRRAAALHAAGAMAPNDYEKLEHAARQAAVGRDLAAKRLADARLVAPFAGVVARKSTEVGATAEPGRAVLTLVDLDVVHVRANVAEGDVARVRAGQRARVTLDSDAGAPGDGPGLAGVVDAVGVAADPASRTFAVKVRVPNADHRLRAGMVAAAEIATGATRPTVAVPAAAVARDADGATLVYLADARAGRARARRVETGAPLGGGLVAVTRGLAAGELVVVAGQQRLRDGARVAVVGTGDRP